MEFVSFCLNYIEQNFKQSLATVLLTFLLAFGVYKFSADYVKRQRNREFQLERSVKKLFKTQMNFSGSVAGSRRLSAGKGDGRNKEFGARGSTNSDPFVSGDAFSSGEEDELEGGANLRFEKLRIGSPEKRNSWTHRYCNPNSFQTPSVTPIAFNSSYSGQTETAAPLWKDYPMVEKAVPSGYSFCSMPVSPSPYYSSGLGSPFTMRNYKSSSTASIFGGPKPLLSPPKLDVMHTQSVIGRPDSCFSPSPYCSHHFVQGRASWGCSSAAENLSGPYLSSPLSRSSSQSSGFISQKGPNTPPPSTANHSPYSGSFVDGRDPDALSVYSDPISTTSGPRRSYPYGFVPLSNTSSYCRSETDFNTGRFWSPSAFSASGTVKPVSMVSGCLNGNTCSRFARKDSDTNLFMKRLIDIRSSSSQLYSEDKRDDFDAGDDNESFESARSTFKTAVKTSGRNTIKLGQSTHSQISVSSDRTSFSKLHSLILNHRRVNEAEDTPAESTKSLPATAPTSPSTWSFFLQIFWSVTLFINVLIMLVLVFCGNTSVIVEFSQELFLNLTNSVVTCVPAYWDSFQQTVVDLLAARTPESEFALPQEL